MTTTKFRATPTNNQSGCISTARCSAKISSSAEGTRISRPQLYELPVIRSFGSFAARRPWCRPPQPASRPSWRWRTVSYDWSWAPGAPRATSCGGGLRRTSIRCSRVAGFWAQVWAASERLQLSRAHGEEGLRVRGAPAGSGAFALLSGIGCLTWLSVVPPLVSLLLCFCCCFCRFHPWVLAATRTCCVYRDRVATGLQLEYQPGNDIPTASPSLRMH